jgi:hypothetical protein
MSADDLPAHVRNHRSVCMQIPIDTLLEFGKIVHVFDREERWPILHMHWILN